jgi:hypothetical protein
MDLDVLRNGYKNLLQHIYSPEVYYQRVKTFLKEYHPPKLEVHLDINNSFEYLLAFFKSIIRLGIVGKERLEYWKLFFWTLFHRPKLFPLAIVFAIYGHHFRLICERHVV